MEKNKLVLKILGGLVLCGFLFIGSMASAEVPGEYLTSSLGTADLMAIAEKYPTLFTVGAGVLIVFCLGYAIYYILFKKKKED